MTTQYFYLTGDYMQYRNWQANWHVPSLSPIYDARTESREDLENLSSFSLIVLDSWYESDKYSQELTDWLFKTAKSVHLTSQVCPILKDGKIVAWREKWRRNKKTKPAAHGLVSVRLDEEELYKLREISEYLSKTTGDPTLSNALRYVLQQFVLPERVSPR